MIRTDNSGPDGDTTVTDERAQRHLAPPMTSQSMAETHGMFDEWDDMQSYDLIVAREGAFPKSTGATEDPLIPLGDLLPNSTLALPYLPDPLANGIALTHLPGLSVGDVATAPIGRPLDRWSEPGRTLAPTLTIETGDTDRWPDPQSGRVQLAPEKIRPTGTRRSAS